MISWPDWWDWDLDLSSHLLRRMEDRCLSEIDLRSMMQSASQLRASHEPGRWVVDVIRDSESWEIVLEPDEHDQVIVVVTAYAVDES